MKLEDALELIEMFHCAEGATKTALASCAALRAAKKGEHIFLDRDQTDQLYFLVSGITSLYKVNHQQDKKVVFICGPGELLNETAVQSGHTTINSEMLSDGRLLVLPERRFQELMSKDFRLAKAYMNDLTRKITRLYHQLQNTSNTMNLEKQIASKLWKLARDHGISSGDGTEIDFDLSISYLADLLGSKRETVSRHVKSLTEKNLILVRKNRFVVRNMEKLSKYFREA